MTGAANGTVKVLPLTGPFDVGLSILQFQPTCRLRVQKTSAETARALIAKKGMRPVAGRIDLRRSRSGVFCK